jgi:3-methyl-2-oxobutanoate hydroxymethyltransferase
MKLSPDDLKTRAQTAAPLVCLTAYTTPMAKLLAPHVDLILVGDSMGMVLYGLENTLGVTADMIARHTAAVRRGAPDTLIVADMPAGTYETGPDHALKHAKLFMESGADAVKLEGGVAYAPTVQALTQADIPVLGHIGLLPQSVEREGGYKIKGKTPDALETLIADAQALENAGVFAMVLEGTVESAARAVVDASTVPVIGIGASPACDGQILVTEDMIGLSGGYLPKFVKPYADLTPTVSHAIETYAREVRTRAFPDETYTY